MVYFYAYQIIRGDTGKVIFQDDDFIQLGQHCMNDIETVRKVKKDLGEELLSSFKYAWRKMNPLYNYELQINFIAFNYAGCC